MTLSRPENNEPMTPKPDGAPAAKLAEACARHDGEHDIYCASRVAATGFALLLIYRRQTRYVRVTPNDKMLNGASA